MRRDVASYAAVALALSSVPVQSQDPPAETPWRLELGLSLVATSGNSDTSSGGLDLDYDQRWDDWGIHAEGKAVRATEQDTTTAERYSGRVRGRRRLSESLELTLGARGDRDRFAGIDLRTVVDGSLLWTITDGERWTTGALIGLSWTHEDTADGKRKFAGGISELKAERRFSETSKLTGRAAFLPNFEESSDYRAEGRIALQASVTSRLALKLAYEVIYASRPPEGFENTDTSLNVSLVVRLGHKQEG